MSTAATTRATTRTTTGVAVPRRYRYETPFTFTPEDIASVVDYGMASDLSRLKQNADGTGAVASLDDPIGWWRGQLDVLTFTQATSNNKAKLGANGVYFLAGGNAKHLSVAYNLATAGPWAIALGYTQESVGSAKGLVIVGDTAAGSFNFRHAVGGSDGAGGYASVKFAAATALTGGPITDGNFLLSFDGADAVGAYNGDETAVAVGGSTTEPNVISISVWDVGCDSTARRWAVFSAALTPEERANMAIWLGMG